MKLHHLGIACENIQEMYQKIKKIHTIESSSEIHFDTEQQVQVQLLNLNTIKLELISGKMVTGLIKRKISLYHTCFTVKNIHSTIKECEAKGARLVLRPKPSILFKGRLVAFMSFPYGLVELLEF